MPAEDPKISDLTLDHFMKLILNKFTIANITYHFVTLLNYDVAGVPPYSQMFPVVFGDEIRDLREKIEGLFLCVFLSKQGLELQNHCSRNTQTFLMSVSLLTLMSTLMGVLGKASKTSRSSGMFLSSPPSTKHSVHTHRARQSSLIKFNTE